MIDEYHIVYSISGIWFPKTTKNTAYTNKEKWYGKVIIFKSHESNGPELSLNGSLIAYHAPSSKCESGTISYEFFLSRLQFVPPPILRQSPSIPMFWRTTLTRYLRWDTRPRPWCRVCRQSPWSPPRTDSAKFCTSSLRSIWWGRSLGWPARNPCPCRVSVRTITVSSR